ncbi:MAG: protein-L-isoaspartate(D-aspartate) O-methyltransferase [Nitrospirota bacterium]|jgi:protein-L-isoaspartate(D-aspartate) O-methyltransferase
MDYPGQRERMVMSQLAARGIRDARVLEAMRWVPRHLFVHEPRHQHLAYEDMALSIGEGQTISQPYIVAAMTELLELTGRELVLEVGTGSGYQTAVLAELSRNVYTIERVDLLMRSAERTLNSLGYRNVHFRVGDGTLGWPEAAPFDRILVTAACPCLPGPLAEQLGEDGAAVAPVGQKHSQDLVKYRKRHGRLIEEDRSVPCVFVPLLGEHGWKER